MKMMRLMRHDPLAWDRDVDSRSSRADLLGCASSRRFRAAVELRTKGREGKRRVGAAISGRRVNRERGYALLTSHAATDGARLLRSNGKMSRRSSLLGLFWSPFSRQQAASGDGPTRPEEQVDERSSSRTSSSDSDQEAPAVMAKSGVHQQKSRKEHSADDDVGDGDDKRSSRSASRDQEDEDSDFSDIEGQEKLDSESDSEPKSDSKKRGRRWKRNCIRTEAAKGKPPIRNPYSLEEDYAIIRHVIDTQAGAVVSGVSFWKECERRRITGVQRTYHSLKERYRRYIVPSIHDYMKLSESEKEKILREIECQSERPSMSAPPSKGVKRLPKASSLVHPDSSPERKKQPGTSSGREVAHLTRSVTKCAKRGSRLSRAAQQTAAAADSADGDGANGHESDKESEEEEEEEEAVGVSEDDSQDEDEAEEEEVRIRAEAARHPKTRKQTVREGGASYLTLLRQKEQEDDVPRTANYYTEDEDRTIIKCMLRACRRNSKEHSLTGNAIWKELEQSKRVPGRSWSSLRERLLKYILPNIQRYNLPAADAAKLLDSAGLSQAKQPRKLRRKAA